jgi:ParB-like chromosome segregation protein Spo0J
MKIESVKIAELRFDPDNARQHDEKNLRAIEESLREFGQRKPIVITKAGVIVAGNGTVEAATRLGWSEIEAVTIPDNWTSEKTKAFALADNRTAELAAWNTEILNAQLQELKESEINIQLLGFEVKNLDLPEDLFSESEAPRLDQRNSISCPQCGCEFRQTAKGFEIV